MLRAELPTCPKCGANATYGPGREVVCPRTKQGLCDGPTLPTEPPMTAPERIWATGNGDTGSWNASPATFRGPIETQFVRADLLDEAVKALEECEADIDAYIRQEYPGDHPVHERYRQRDFSANPARIALAKLRSKP